jgi:hypothetical protein
VSSFPTSLLIIENRFPVLLKHAWTVWVRSARLLAG